jgi:hypothetical protein
MTRNPDPASLEPIQELAQFEPDPDGVGCRDGEGAAVAAPADDPQWVVFPDPADESAWAASELSHIGAGKG